MARVGFRQGPCPRFSATEGLKMINGRWKVPILMVLAEGPRRFRELERALDGVSHKMLAQQLAALVEDRLLERRELISEVPKTVEYRLSALGERTRPLLSTLAELGRNRGESRSDP